MSSNFVKILIKAPNQLVEDQTVHCERNWTVKRLKHHLANVYPCKPHPDGQKLIYSGQLLSDEAVLSEVLRSYDGHENNTIHLVCSMRDTQKMNRLASKTAQQQQQEFPTLPRESNASWGGDHIGQHTTNPGPTGPGPITFQNVGNNAQDMFQQNVLLQQAYFNYMAHFSQLYMMANANRVRTTDNVNYSYNPVNANNPAPNNEAQDIPAHNRNEIEAEEGHDEARANRDWLEWFYIGSRFFILFTVVYFYSSPERFILVIFMALILINVDVFRWRRVHQNQPANNTPVNEETTQVSPPPANVIVPMNWIHVTWSFMKTFFLSLVPDNRDI